MDVDLNVVAREIAEARKAGRKCQVYIAAPFPLKLQAERMRLLFLAAGAEVCSHWITEPPEAQECHEEALHDLLDIEGADAFVVLNPRAWWEKGTGGRHVELGYALHDPAKHIVLVGAPSNVFHRLHRVDVIEDEHDFEGAVDRVMARWLGREIPHG